MIYSLTIVYHAVNNYSDNDEIKILYINILMRFEPVITKKSVKKIEDNKYTRLSNVCFFFFYK